MSVFFNTLEYTLDIILYHYYINEDTRYQSSRMTATAFMDIVYPRDMTNLIIVKKIRMTGNNDYAHIHYDGFNIKYAKYKYRLNNNKRNGKK